MKKHHLRVIALAVAALVATSSQGATMTPVSGGPQIVLYFTQSLWSSGKPERLYGVRLDAIRPLPNSPLVTAVGLVQRRELLNLQIGPHSDIRLQLGRRVSWDFTREEFGPQSGLPRVTIGLPITAFERSETDHLQPWDPRTPPSILTIGRP
jgi:hypothetical protein